MTTLNRCECGVMTNYGATCVSCSSTISHFGDERFEINVDYESLFIPDDTDPETDAPASPSEPSPRPKQS